MKRGGQWSRELPAIFTPETARNDPLCFRRFMLCSTARGARVTCRILRERGLGGRVEFTALAGADHDDQRFASEENLGIVLDFICRAIQDADRGAK